MLEMATKFIRYHDACVCLGDFNFVENKLAFVIVERNLFARIFAEPIILCLTGFEVYNVHYVVILGHLVYLSCQLDFFDYYSLRTKINFGAVAFLCTLAMLFPPHVERFFAVRAKMTALALHHAFFFNCLDEVFDELLFARYLAGLV